MTSLADFLGAVNSAGLRLANVGGRLRLLGPPGAITPEIRAAAVEHRAAILPLLPDEVKAEGNAARGPTPPRDISGLAIMPTSNVSVSVGTPAHGVIRPVFIDLETRSASNLKREGGRRYARHETTEILTAVALIDGRVIAWVPTLDAPPPAGQLWPDSFGPALPVEAFAGPGLPPPLADATTAGRPFCAHNAHTFDQHVWAARGLPLPSAWLDTLPEARACGLPGKLDQLGQKLFRMGKDKEGERLVRRLCRPGRRGEFPPFDREEAVAVLRYNLADVLLLARLYEVVAGHAEPDVVALDLVINGRGVAFDCELARALIALEVQASREIGAEAERLACGAVKAGDLRRTKFLLGWLRSRGVELPNLQKGTVRELLRDRPDLDAGVRGVLGARLAVNRVTAGKLQSAVAACDGDGRLRDLLVYHKAHTGRWAARRVQPHNLPRPHPDLHDLGPLHAAAGDLPGFRRAMPPSVGLADALSALIRPCFRAAPGKVLCVADFAGVEARGVAWCANETGLLRLFARGGDPYCDLAAKIFDCPVTKEMKRERGVGKEAVLGCGYGMGPDRFAETCAARGVDLAAAGVTAEGVVEGYRDAYPAIAGTRVGADGFTRREGGLWNDVEAAARLAVGKGMTGRAGRCEFYREGDALVVRLPSGRRLHYRNARIENRVPGYCRDLGLTPARKPTIVYDDPEKGEVVTYGGKLVENIVQAICRDLLVAALLGCEREGLPVVLHVHDEVVVEVPTDRGGEALRRVVAIMSTPPAWAEGFPVEVEGFVSERYVKTPPPGAAVVRARNGAVLADQGPLTAPVPAGEARAKTARTGAEAETGPGPHVSWERRSMKVEGEASRLTAPLKWHGGKSYLARRIVALMPPHLHYVEPYAGGLAVLLARDPGDCRLWAGDTGSSRGVSEVVNDIDGRLMNFWRVLRDPELFPRFLRQVQTIPLARTAWEEAHAHEYGKDPLADAVAFFVNCRQSLAGRMKGFTAITRTRTRRGTNGNVSEWLSAVEGLPAVHERLIRVVVENRPALDIVRQEDGPGTLFYCDPPYLHQTRTARDVYAHEMTEGGHRELLEVLRQCRGKVMLSGYPSELYDTALADWTQHTFDLPNNAAGGKAKGRETEVLWCNF